MRSNHMHLRCASSQPASPRLTHEAAQVTWTDEDIALVAVLLRRQRREEAQPATWREGARLRLGLRQTRTALGQERNERRVLQERLERLERRWMLRNSIATLELATLLHLDREATRC